MRTCNHNLWTLVEKVFAYWVAREMSRVSLNSNVADVIGGSLVGDVIVGWPRRPGLLQVVDLTVELADAIVDRSFLLSPEALRVLDQKMAHQVAGLGALLRDAALGTGRWIPWAFGAARRFPWAFVARHRRLPPDAQSVPSPVAARVVRLVAGGGADVAHAAGLTPGSPRRPTPRLARQGFELHERLWGASAR